MDYPPPSPPAKPTFQEFGAMLEKAKFVLPESLQPDTPEHEVSRWKSKSPMGKGVLPTDRKISMVENAVTELQEFIKNPAATEGRLDDFRVSINTRVPMAELAGEIIRQDPKRVHEILSPILKDQAKRQAAEELAARTGLTEQEKKDALLKRQNELYAGFEEKLTKLKGPELQAFVAEALYMKSRALSNMDAREANLFRAQNVFAGTLPPADDIIPRYTDAVRLLPEHLQTSENSLLINSGASEQRLMDKYRDTISAQQRKIPGADLRDAMRQGLAEEIKGIDAKIAQENAKTEKLSKGIQEVSKYLETVTDADERAATMVYIKQEQAKLDKLREQQKEPLAKLEKQRDTMQADLEEAEKLAEFRVKNADKIKALGAELARVSAENSKELQNPAYLVGSMVPQERQAGMKERIAQRLAESMNLNHYFVRSDKGNTQLVVQTAGDTPNDAGDTGVTMVVNLNDPKVVLKFASDDTTARLELQEIKPDGTRKPLDKWRQRPLDVEAALKKPDDELSSKPESKSENPQFSTVDSSNITLTVPDGAVVDMKQFRPKSRSDVVAYGSGVYEMPDNPKELRFSVTGNSKAPVIVSLDAGMLKDKETQFFMSSEKDGKRAHLRIENKDFKVDSGTPHGDGTLALTDNFTLRVRGSNGQVRDIELIKDGKFTMDEKQLRESIEKAETEMSKTPLAPAPPPRPVAPGRGR